MADESKVAKFDKGGNLPRGGKWVKNETGKDEKVVRCPPPASS